MSASVDESCGITSANTAYCWGRNVEGQIGDGTYGYNNFRVKPTKVVGGLSFVTLGGTASSAPVCAITANDRAYCWGSNSHGQLGIGITSKRQPPPVAVQWLN